MDCVCQKCQECFKNLAALHGHVTRAHNLKLKDYYYIYFPRSDLYSNEMIEFKNLNYYMETSFNSRANFIAWLKSCNKDQALNYFTEFLQNRKKRKNLRFLPCHVELKTLISPSYHSILKILNSEKLLNDFSNSLNLEKKYIYFDSDIKFYEPNEPICIYVDTREQNPFVFKDCSTISMKLISGDYVVKNEDLYSDVYIERKSINDLYGTMGSGFDRFSRELTRAKELDHYIVIVVESSLEEAINFTPYHSNKSFNMMSSVRRICQTFDNCQFVFGSNRSECSSLVKKIFKLKQQVRHLDLQFIKEKGII